MQTETFYQLLDKELEVIIDSNKNDENISKHKEDNQKKGYALLIWFLEFYSKKSSYKNYITDGNDDFSCDIILNDLDVSGNTIFYVIQSKWCNKNNSAKPLSSNEVKQSLNDFDTILSGTRKDGKNILFNEKRNELLKHLKNNGEVKFIFFSLAQYNPKISDNIADFQLRHSKAKIEIIDIEKIKKHYIDTNYKELIIDNPIDLRNNPEQSLITIEFEKINPKSNRNFIEIEHFLKGYIFILKPKTIYDLFAKYGFSLFYKNVRNPLMKSNKNTEIVNTLKERPDKFWYFNNGITAITKIVPEIGEQATSVEILGFQIINGAQTVYSIYTTYRDATEIERQVINTDAKITLRLIRSSDENTNLNITRFTNLQNIVYDRDFRANDFVQERIQDDFFKNTNIWYEKRRSEFRKIPSKRLGMDIKVVSNEILAQTYLAYYKQDPHNAKSKKRFLFISKKENTKEGLYEEVFNENTNYEDMLIANFLFEFIEREKKSHVKKEKKINTIDELSEEQLETLKYSFIPSVSFEILALMRDVLLIEYENNAKQLNGLILDNIKKNNYNVISKSYSTIIENIKELIEEKKKNPKFRIDTYLKKQNTYHELRINQNK